MKRLVLLLGLFCLMSVYGLSQNYYDDLYYIPDSDDEEIVTSKYVNEDEIKGKYYIFIRINGTIYKLNKYVVFY